MSALRLDDLDVTLSQLMTDWPQTIPVFLKYRMLCVGCPINRFHTVADACIEYRLDEADFLIELHMAISWAT